MGAGFLPADNQHLPVLHAVARQAHRPERPVQVAFDVEGKQAESRPVVGRPKPAVADLAVPLPANHPSGEFQAAADEALHEEPVVEADIPLEHLDSPGTQEILGRFPVTDGPGVDRRHPAVGKGLERQWLHGYRPPQGTEGRQGRFGVLRGHEADRPLPRHQEARRPVVGGHPVLDLRGAVPVAAGTGQEEAPVDEFAHFVGKTGILDHGHE